MTRCAAGGAPRTSVGPAARRAVAWTLLVAIGPAWTARAGAQDPAPQSPPGALAPTLAGFTVDGRQLRAGALQYDVLVTGDSGVRHVGWYTTWIYDARFGGRPGWEVMARRESRPPFAVRVAQDSVILSRESLAPLRWEGTAAGGRFVAAFANDSVYGGVSATDARTTFTLAVPSPVVTSEGALDVMLAAASLADGWRAAATMLVVDLGGARLLPLQLAVTGSEVVHVPAGRFDSWVVTVTAPGATRSIWVDRGSGRVVRTRELPPHMPGMTVERVLVGAF